MQTTTMEPSNTTYLSILRFHRRTKHGNQDCHKPHRNLQSRHAPISFRWRHGSWRKRFRIRCRLRGYHQTSVEIVSFCWEHEIDGEKISEAVYFSTCRLYSMMPYRAPSPLIVVGTQHTGCST